MRRIIYVMLAAIILMTVCLVMSGRISSNWRDLAYEQDEVIKIQNDRLEAAGERIRELELKVEFYEDVTDGRFNITVQPLEDKVQ